MDLIVSPEVMAKSERCEFLRKTLANTKLLAGRASGPYKDQPTAKSALRHALNALPKNNGNLTVEAHRQQDAYLLEIVVHPTFGGRRQWAECVDVFLNGVSMLTGGETSVIAN